MSAKANIAAIMASTMLGTAAHAQQPGEDIRAELDRAMEMIRQQQEQLDRQREEIAELRRRLDSAAPAVAAASPAAPSAVPSSPAETAVAASAPNETVPLQRVGVAPEDDDRPIEIAVLDNQSSVVTPTGRLIAETFAQALRPCTVSRLGLTG